VKGDKLVPVPHDAEEEPMKKYVVKLTGEERAALVALTSKGRTKARRLKRALILLAADDGDTDVVIAAKLRTDPTTVARIRQRFVEESLDAALAERPRPGARRASWMGARRRIWWPWRAASRRPAATSGRCNCWRSAWSNWAWWRRSATRRCDAP
jgi:hypothetical protein